MVNFGASISSPGMPPSFLEYKMFPEYCSFIVWCENGSTKLWYFEDLGCQNVRTGSNLFEEMSFWRVVCFLQLSFASCFSLICSWMSYLLCQWFYIAELSKNWECLPFFGGACREAGRREGKKDKSFSWLSFLSWNDSSISSYSFGHWSNLSAYPQGTPPAPPCVSQYSVPVCLFLFLHCHSVPLST